MGQANGPLALRLALDEKYRQICSDHSGATFRATDSIFAGRNPWRFAVLRSGSGVPLIDYEIVFLLTSGISSADSELT